MGGFDFLLGNGIGWLLKNKWEGFNTKFIPAGLFVWNVLYHALKAVAPESVPDLMPQGALWQQTGDVVVQVGWFGSAISMFGGLFADAALDTAKQMALHATAKNSLAQALIPAMAKKAKERYGTRR